MKNPWLMLFLMLAVCTCMFAQDKPACPLLSVSGPGAVPKPGDEIIFTARVEGESKDAILKYKWSISTGEIAGGQGTGEVKVKPDEKNSSFTVTVEITGFPDGCKNMASENLYQDLPPQAVLADVIGGCPKVSVETSPVAVIDGYPMIFTAKISGATSGGTNKLKYHWTISNGEIAEGQGTSEIKVDTLGLQGEEVKATVKITGLSKRCKTRASATGFVKIKPYLSQK